MLKCFENARNFIKVSPEKSVSLKLINTINNNNTDFIH